MNRLVIIGNGFDLAHGLKTSYVDFINWYWEQLFLKLRVCNDRVYNDGLISLNIVASANESSWMNVFFFHNELKQQSWQEVLKYIRTREMSFRIEYSALFNRIMAGFESKGWVDIENDYYTCLKTPLKNPRCGYTVNDINTQLGILQSKLVDYLRTIEIENIRGDLHDKMLDLINPKDFSGDGKQKALDSIGCDVEDIEKIKYNHELLENYIPQSIMLLSFNYTDTAKFFGNNNLTLNYIHGELSREKEIIFGYGDELDKDYKELLDMNDNELLKYAKNVKYLETSHYRQMLNFINAGPFQVFIMGHSCGNSDRTLLNTVFEHENCVSIKPFYYKKENGTDNYLELVQNISRNFTDMKLFRDRVVNKEQCLTM